MKFLDITEGKDPRLGLASHEFDVNGYSYYTDIDDDGDVKKIWHYAKTPDGDVVDIDYTPYDYMDKRTFSAWIEQGMPGRKGLGPLRREDFLEGMEASNAQKLLAEIGRTLMDKAVTTKDDELSTAMSRLGNELTGYGEIGYAKKTKELARKTGLNPGTISKLVDYGHAVLKKEGPVRVGGKSDMDEDAVDERQLTGGEKRSKEAKFKKLKKARGDFEKRYGKDAESVMHAVATKQAKAKSKNEGIDELIRTQMILLLLLLCLLWMKRSLLTYQDHQDFF